MLKLLKLVIVPLFQGKGKILEEKDQSERGLPQFYQEVEIITLFSLIGIR